MREGDIDNGRCIANDLPVRRYRLVQIDSVMS